MKTELHLDAKDIKKIIADYFKVDISKVEVKPYTTTTGYGPMEHEVADVKAIIQQEGDLCNYGHQLLLEK